MDDSLLMEGNGQFDFDGASKGSGDGSFGAGWEDDLEEMLIKGMKKKAQRRIAMMGAVLLLGMGLGALCAVGYVIETTMEPPSPPPPPPPSPFAAVCLPPDCKGCKDVAMTGVGFEPWNVFCSADTDLAGLDHRSDCLACDGGPGKCDHGCLCRATCDSFRGVEVNPSVVGADELYEVVCNDGRWTHERCSPADAIAEKFGGTAECLLCEDKDECKPGADGLPVCKNGGHCHDQPAGVNGTGYSCICQDGFSGPNCETDFDDCKPNGTDAGPCGSNAQQCVESSRVWNLHPGQSSDYWRPFNASIDPPRNQRYDLFIPAINAQHRDDPNVRRPVSEGGPTDNRATLSAFAPRTPGFTVRATGQTSANSVPTRSTCVVNFRPA
eukprot:COSAG05_NODE_1302_length_5240_cov_3.393309_5_plen_382_part_00